MSAACPRYSVLLRLLGLYSAMTKSAFPAASTLSMIFSMGVMRSDRLMRAVSCIRGAPSTAAPVRAAERPGTTTTSTSG